MNCVSNQNYFIRHINRDEILKGGKVLELLERREGRVLELLGVVVIIFCSSVAITFTVTIEDNMSLSKLPSSLNLSVIRIFNWKDKVRPRTVLYFCDS